MQIIANWLAGSQNFAAGSIIYKKIGTNEAFKKLLQNGETPFVKKQLSTELQNLLKKPVLKPVPAIQKETAEMPAGTDAVLVAIKNEWQPLYQRMNLLRHQLDKYDEDNSEAAMTYRKALANEIKQLDKECNAIWAKRDYYLKRGQLPFVAPVKTEIPSDALELAKLINNTKKGIRTNRKLLKDNPDNARYAQLYNQYKEKYVQITGKAYEEKA